MLKKLFQSKFLTLSLILSFILLITIEAAPRNINHSPNEEFKPIVKVKEAREDISPVQKERFEKLIEEGKKLLQEEMDYEGAIKKFSEARDLAITKEQKVAALFYLSLGYYATIGEKGEEEFEATIRKLLEIDYYRELDELLCPPRYVQLFRGIKKEYGTLKVQSKPAGADVYLGDSKDPVGQTPITVGSKEGIVKIRVKKGKREKKDTLSVVAGKETTSPTYILKGRSSLIYVIGGIVLAGGVGAALLMGKKRNGKTAGPTTGSIQVNSNPTGAKVYLDGNDTGKTTNTNLTDVSPGSHIVKLVKEGYKNAEQSVSVTAGQTANLNISLSQHTITVTSPTSSTIWEKETEVEIKWTYDEAIESLGNINSNASINNRLHQGNSLSPEIKNRIVRYNPSSKRTTSLREKADDVYTSRNSEELLKESIQGRKSSQQKSLTMKVEEKEHVNLNEMRSMESINTSKRFNLPISPKPSFGFPNPSSQGSKSGDDIRILILTNVKIELYYGGGVVETIASSTANDGSFTWEIPVSLQVGTNYMVRISSVDDSNVYGESGVFEIKANPFFFDDFEDGNADGWIIDQGWQVEKDGSNFVLSGSSPEYQYANKKEAWNNYRLKARIKLIEGDMHFCFYRENSGPGAYFIGLTTQNIYLAKESLQGGFTDLAQANLDINYNEWHTVEAVGTGGNLKVYFDDVLLLEYFDPDPYSYGGIFFANSPYGHVHIDDVLVEEIK